jgi:hypothetical protein
MDEEAKVHRRQGQGEDQGGKADDPAQGGRCHGISLYP